MGYQVERIIAHPQWDASQLSHDISLLELAADVQMNDMVQPIALPTEYQDFSGNQDCVISGWGELGWNQGGPNILQALDVEVKDMGYCKQMYYYTGPPGVHQTTQSKCISMQR